MNRNESEKERKSVRSFIKDATDSTASGLRINKCHRCANVLDCPEACSVVNEKVESVWNVKVEWAQWWDLDLMSCNPWRGHVLAGKPVYSRHVIYALSDRHRKRAGHQRGDVEWMREYVRRSSADDDGDGDGMVDRNQRDEMSRSDQVDCSHRARASVVHLGVEDLRCVRQCEHHHSPPRIGYCNSNIRGDRRGKRPLRSPVEQ